MVILQNLWWLLVLVGIMILIHELGHYWAARWFKVRVEVFSFGFGPRLFGFRRGDTDFRFSAILFGGYVKMSGEQPNDENAAADPNSFAAKPRWQRLIIAAAGPAMNVILAVALLAGLFMVRYPKVANGNGPLTIGFVKPASPASAAGIQEGDRVVAVDGQPNPTYEDVMLKVAASANHPVPLIIERQGRRLPLTLIPGLDDKSGAGIAGFDEQHEVQIDGFVAGMHSAQNAGLKPGDVIVSANGRQIRSILRLHEILREGNGSPVELVYRREGKQQTARIQPEQKDMDGTKRWMLGVQLAPRVTFVSLSLPEAVEESIRQNIKGATLIYDFLGGLVTQNRSPKSLEGPIRIAQLSGEAAREGAATFVFLMANVSLNLAIFNLLPIPILDGGLILLLLVEMLIRRDLSLNVKEAVFKVGMAFLMAVVIFVLYNDLSKILPG